MQTLTNDQKEKLATIPEGSGEWWNLNYVMQGILPAHVKNLIVKERQDISQFNWANIKKGHDINSVYCLSVPVQSTIDGELCAGNLLLCFNSEGELTDNYVSDWEKMPENR